ncbi:MAG: diadenylate cyclase CdaA [Anaerolineae bacterium]|nr:diadenylate cyclase CdaA [Anaerolineae bacterium]
MFQTAFWLVQRINSLALLDIVLVATVFFGVLSLVRATQAIPLLRGMLLITAISVMLGGLAQLPTFGMVIKTIVPALLVAIPVIFQPELRRALERLGRISDLLGSPRHTELEDEVSTISKTAQKLSQLGHGALIILQGNTGLQNLVDTGTPLNAKLTVELLLTIFHPNTPLHDGGVIIAHNQIIAAGCVLPLTHAHLDDHRMGLRHRAGLGVSEATDAIAIIVSEETGSISVAHEGRITRNISLDDLQKMIFALRQSSHPIDIHQLFSSLQKNRQDD